jgi:hypothetical protein
MSRARKRLCFNGMALKHKRLWGGVSELLGENQEPEGNRQGSASRVIFAALVTLVLSGILSWVFVPSVRVLGYQVILIVGPVDARKWSVKKLEGYNELAVTPLVIALKDKEWEVREAAAKSLGKIGRNAGMPDHDMSDHGPAKVEKAVPALIEALKDKNKKAREAAQKALEKIQQK